MMRCPNCTRDYPDGLRFCHQCGEPLQRHDLAAGSPGAPPRPDAAQPAPRGAGRRRAPARSSLLFFAILAVLALGVGLVLVRHQRWVPSERVSARIPEAPGPRPADPLAPPPAPEAPEPAPRAPTPAPGPASGIAPPPASPPDGPLAARPSPAPARPPDPPARKAVARAPAPAPDPGRAVRPDAPASPPRPAAPGAGTRPGSAGRSDSGATPSGSAPRVITLVPVGAGAGARAQLHWEPGEGGRLVVAGLPQPPPGRTYQFWLGSIRLGTRASGGVLSVDPEGAGTLRVAPLRATWSPDIFGVTVERHGGAREPSDDLVLVGELSQPTATAAAPARQPEPGAGASRPPAVEPGTAPADGLPAPAEGAREGGSAPTTAASPEPGAETGLPALPASRPPAGAAQGAGRLLVRIVPAPVERTWSATQSALRSLGWSIDRADQAEGLIRTRPRNVEFKNLGLYAAGTRHTLDVVIRPVSSSHTSIAVKRELFEEQRILWSKERTTLPPGDTTVEQTVLDAIEHRL